MQIEKRRLSSYARLQLQQQQIPCTISCSPAPIYGSSRARAITLFTLAPPAPRSGLEAVAMAEGNCCTRKKIRCRLSSAATRPNGRSRRLYDGPMMSCSNSPAPISRFGSMPSVGSALMYPLCGRGKNLHRSFFYLLFLCPHGCSIARLDCIAAACMYNA